MTADLNALWLTLQLAACSTLILLLIGTPLAWWLAKTQSKSKTIVEALVALPLILPPTVLGFYLLIAFSQNGPIGWSLNQLGLPQLAFSFEGLVVGSIIYSLPFVVQPLQNTFSGIRHEIIEAAACLGVSPWHRFRRLVLPLSKGGYLTAAVLGFAHTIGEFGVILMIGGNIPGETRVLSIAIYDHVEALEYTDAHRIAASLLVFSFVTLYLLYRSNQKRHIQRK